MIDYFFSVSGRIARKHYWIASLVIIALVFTAAIIGFVLTDLGWGTYSAFATPAVIFLIGGIASVCVGVRRLHDRDKSWHWIIPFYAIPVILDPQWFGLGFGNTLYWVMSAVSLGLSLWALVELGILRGTEGNNSYGEDPLNPMPSAQVFE